MESVRQIIDSELLDKLQLPPHLRNRKVEIIIMPVEKDTEKRKKSIKDLIGIAHEYANPDLIPLEKEAWGIAMEEKHGNR
jgi:predicted glycosyltransferase